MKRPVFCVALAYALGEVIGLYTRTVGEIGIVSAMLVCVGIFMRKKILHTAPNEKLLG